MQIALFTQDPQSKALVTKVAAAAGHGCVSLTSVKALQEFLQRESCDLLVIEGEDFGTTKTVLVWVRSHLASTFPVMLLAAASQEAIVEALAQGVTDYLVKPLRQGELALRLRVALQRAYPQRFASALFSFGDYVFDENTSVLTLKDKPVDLTQKEFALALLFFRHMNRPLSRAFIVEKIWSRDMEVSSRTIDTHVSRVRNKLRLKPENGFKLVPVYSFGYRLEQVPARRDATDQALRTG